MAEVYRAVLLVMILDVLVITYAPWFSMWLLSLLTGP